MFCVLLFQDECYDLELYNWTKVDISDEVRLHGGMPSTPFCVKEVSPSCGLSVWT
jgi:hypothetical protein